jgi:phytoene desaturase
VYSERTEEYWQQKTMAPSAFILYLGLNKKMPSLVHHNLFFSTDWDTNFKQIIDYDRFPDNPSMYVSCPSYTDETVAPAGHENIFVLVPISSGLSYTEEDITRWTEYTLQALEEKMGCTDIRKHIEYKRVYCVKDFEKDYFAYKGSALGMAHTLLQSAFWRPNNMSTKVDNLYYVGANNNPGIGMPICLMSAETVYKRIMDISSPEPLTSALLNESITKE